jgi:hypothetical protein
VPPGLQKRATPSQARESGSAHNEKKGDQQAEGAGQQGPRDPKNPSMDDINQLAKDLKSSDPQKQVQADRDLRQIAKEATDAKKREAAKEALKNGETPGGGSPKPEATSEKPANTAAGNTGKTGKEDPTKTGGAGKPDGKGGPDKTGKTDAQGNPTTKTGNDQQTGKGSNSDGKTGDPASNDPAKGQGGGAPGAGTTGNRPNDDAQGGPAGEAPPASAADLNNKKKAADLQLEELMKKITPEMLKERNWTAEDLQRWHKNMKDLINRNHQREMEKLPGPQRGGAANLPGSFRRTDGSTAPTQDVQNIGKTTPPPDIRNAYQEFTQELSKDLAKKKGK